MKFVTTYECPTKNGIIITDIEGHEFDCVEFNYENDQLDVLIIDNILKRHGLELNIYITSHKNTYVAVKPILQRKIKMDIMKIVLTALSMKVEKYINKIVRFVEQNK